jgi:dTDP-4-dehydrorhamnose 3,5-epimerase-like enzyme
MDKKKYNIKTDMQPSLIKGNSHIDARGSLKYNNEFNASQVKRIYSIENANIQLKRGWQGHKIEQRWFSAISGKFEILVIKIDNWDNPDINSKPSVFELSSETLDFLHIPSSYVTCIQAIEENSKLLIMADYVLGEVDDECRFLPEQFKCTIN